ncbi:MAG: hypothetical protein ACE5HI_07300 [bacterium]
MQLGGWGYLLGDAGSGYDIGRVAIREALNACEIGEEPSELTRQLLSFYEVDRPKDLITNVHFTPNPQEVIASSAKLVCEQALKGEPHAIRIINTATNALLELTLSAIEQLDTTPPYKIALTGSILSKDSPVVYELKKKAEKQKLEFRYVCQTMLPVAAGVLMSVQSAGKMVSNSLKEKMNKVRFEY